MSYASEVLADSPKAYWRLGESSGTSAADGTGNGRTGTYVNSPTLGVAGALSSDSDTAVTFSGTDKRVTVADHADLRPGTGDFSVEFWFKAASNPVLEALYTKGGLNTSAAVWIRNTTGRIIFLTGGGSTVFAETTSGYCDGNWHHVVGAITRATNPKIYVDGTSVSLVTVHTDSTDLNATDGVAIGGRPGTALPFTGSLDEVAFYQGTALSAARVTAHFNAASGPATVSGAAAVSGTGTVSASATRSTFATSSVSGAGTISASTTRTAIAAAAVAGAGTVNASATRSAIVLASILGGSPAVYPGFDPSTSIFPAGDSIVVSGVRSAIAIASIQGTGGVNATGGVTRLGAAVLAGTGSLSATGTRSTFALASLLGEGVISADALRTAMALAAISGTGTISATGQIPGEEWLQDNGENWAQDTDQDWAQTSDTEWIMS